MVLNSRVEGPLVCNGLGLEFTSFEITAFAHVGITFASSGDQRRTTSVRIQASEPLVLSWAAPLSKPRPFQPRRTKDWQPPNQLLPLIIDGL